MHFIRITLSEGSRSLALIAVFQLDMVTSPAEYRSRLSATQQSRKSRRGNRNSGPVDLDDFYIPASPTSQSRRRSKASSSPTDASDQPNGDTLVDVKESRSQSAPRASQQYIKTREASANSRNLHDYYGNLRNGDTVFCFQPGRRRQDNGTRRRSSSQTRPSAALTSDKKSLSQLQLISEQLKLDREKSLMIEKDSENATKELKGSPVKRSPCSQSEKLSLPPLPKDPRVFAANYYAAKAGIRKNTLSNKYSNRESQANVMDTSNLKAQHGSVERTVSQKMTDCLMLAKSLYEIDEKDEANRISNRIHTFCFGTGQADVSNDSIETADITADDNGYSNNSIVDKSATLQQHAVGTKNPSASKSLTFTWFGDTSTNQSTTATSSCSSSDDDTDPTNRPPKILNVKKTSLGSTKKLGTIQVNPDDFDVSYRKGTSKQANDDSSVHALDPFRVDVPSRSLQRRPRGVFENVISKNRDDGTVCSKPYDEIAAHVHVRSEPAVSKTRDVYVDLVRDRSLYESKYLESLNVIESQKNSMLALENQLRDALHELESVKGDLQRSKDESAKRSQVFEESTARVFRERIDIDERLRKEIHTNHHLNDELSRLQREVASMSVELERAHLRSKWGALQQSDAVGIALADDLSVSSMKSDPVNVKEAKSLDVIEAKRSLELITEKLVASEAYARNLQTRLSEAQAAEFLTNQTIAKLKCDRDEAFQEISSLKSALTISNDIAEDLRKTKDLFDKEKQESSRLMWEVESLRNDLCESNFKVNDLSSSLQKFEGEFTRLQLDAARYQIQVSTLERQLLREKENSSSMIRTYDLGICSVPVEDKINDADSSSDSLLQVAEDLMEVKRIAAFAEQTVTTDEQKEKYPCFTRATNETKRGPSDLLDILRMRLDQT